MSRLCAMWFIGVVLVVGVACGGSPDANSNLPTSAILSPASGDSVPVNEIVIVNGTGSDPNGAGVFRLDLIVDGTIVDTHEADQPQELLTAELSFTPGREGATSVGVVAYRQDGTASIPATIALSVVGMTSEAQADAQSGGSDEDTGDETPTTPDSQQPTSSDGNPVLAVTVNQTSVRSKPGPACELLGVITSGTTIELLLVTDNPGQYWYQTNALGDDNIGWVYHTSVRLQDNDNELTRVDEQGCGFCGDALCTEALGENCNTCGQDCGACPFCGDGIVNQSSEQCDGGGCAAGQYCNASCQCGVNDGSDGTLCGDGICQPGESPTWCGDCPS